MHRSSLCAERWGSITTLSERFPSLPLDSVNPLLQHLLQGPHEQSLDSEETGDSSYSTSVYLFRVDDQHLQENRQPPAHRQLPTGTLQHSSPYKEQQDVTLWYTGP